MRVSYTAPTGCKWRMRGRLRDGLQADVADRLVDRRPPRRCRTSVIIGFEQLVLVAR